MIRESFRTFVAFQLLPSSFILDSHRTLPLKTKVEKIQLFGSLKIHTSPKRHSPPSPPVVRRNSPQNWGEMSHAVGARCYSIGTRCHSLLDEMSGLWSEIFENQGRDVRACQKFLPNFFEYRGIYI